MMSTVSIGGLELPVPDTPQETPIKIFERLEKAYGLDPKITKHLVENRKLTTMQEFADSFRADTIETKIVTPCNLGDAGDLMLGRLIGAHRAIKRP